MNLAMLQSVTLHTNLGDVKIELFCEQVRDGYESISFLARQLQLRPWHNSGILTAHVSSAGP